VDQHKTYYCREYFNQEKDNILNDREFQQFVNENKDWLIPYAAFSTLRDKYHTADFSQWGEYARYDSDTASKICDKYFFFIQFALHKQFSAVASYARSNRIVLKGDIPIGINRESVEAWTEPEYFNMNGQTGAPPDDFSDTGQNWSFPTYNWDVMEKDDYGWWKKRFCKLGAYFDCFRIDHILGFFRIWEIPCDYIDGLCGHFRPALPLTKTELANYGLNYREEWTTPRINTMFLNEIFGDIPFSELQEYLTYSDADHLTLSALYSTQRKIALHQDCNKTVTEGLMRIATEVLFVKDPYQPDSFHPRISAYKSFIYRELTHKEKSIFDKLYYDFYYVRHNEFWKQTALKRLTPLVQSTEMLVCGEDLGMIPATVHEVMDKLQIFTLELERAPKLYGVEFANLAQLPLHSVCTTSTHDMNPVRAWWKEVPDRTQRYYNEILKRSGAAPSECSADIATQIITGHLRSSSMLVIIPFQDWLATDDDIKYPDADAERINIPSDPDNYWRYRMHVMLENPHLYSVLTKMVKMGNSNTVTSVSAE